MWVKLGKVQIACHILALAGGSGSFRLESATMCLFPSQQFMHQTEDPRCKFWRNIMMGSLVIYAGIVVLDLLW